MFLHCQTEPVSQQQLDLEQRSWATLTAATDWTRSCMKYELLETRSLIFDLPKCGIKRYESMGPGEVAQQYSLREKMFHHHSPTIKFLGGGTHVNDYYCVSADTHLVLHIFQG